MANKGGGIADFPHLGHRERTGVLEGDPLEQIRADIHALRETHVIPPLMQPKQITLAATGDEETIDSQTAKVSWLICQAFSGTVDVFWGAAGSGSIPHARFSATPFPIVIPVSAKPYTFTVRANVGPATFSITLVA